ncbi:spore coat U domain-containing protein [Sphingomonas solaris]|uniref:Spore coat protein U domain-containing protein n=1 Tax=Alterirhizorhabdus solaris TaxID=2529389 RepID=A0A558QYK9_9SPHN|nr:spore coat protein U domain-containing protein [Sphingomonas solaris]TVV72246.1 spore coat protein U domain-containing protein [Sphingomonas solaris]
MRMILRLLLVMLGLAAAPAQAACSLTAATTTVFAASSSYDVRAASVATVAAPTSLTCNGAILGVLSANVGTATMTSSNAFRLTNGSGDSIGYRMSADAAGTVAFTQGSTIDYFNPSLLALLSVLNPNSFVPTMYATLTDTPNVPAGTYTDTVVVQWAWQICRGIGVGGLCILQEVGSGTTTMTVRIVVGLDCRISAPAVSFGSAPLASLFGSVTQAVAVDCTKGTPFNIAFTSGTGGASRPWRTMKDGAGHVLQYNLYRPDATTIWDQTNPLVGAATGTGATTPGQMIPYVARINPDQATPPVGTYTDTVSVVVTF